MIYIVFLSGLLGAIGQYIDKHLVTLGISRKDYFYYMCVSMVPFSVIMVAIEYFTSQLRFVLNLASVALLLLAMLFRYVKQHTIVGCLQYLNPYEESAYMTLGIILAYIIDVILKIESLDFMSILSVLLITTGIFAFSNAKLKFKNLQKDLFVRIVTTLITSYITHYILRYWSNAVFILILNLLLTVLFCKDYSLEYHKEHGTIVKWVFTQQTFGFFTLYLSNYLTSHSVTLSSYVKPVSIAIVVLISVFFKENSKRPTPKQLVSIAIVVLGVLLIN